MPSLSTAPSRTRSRAKAVLPLHQALLARTELIDLLNSLPYLALVVDRSRQIIFANQALLDTFGLNGLADALGQRPGELLACLNADSHAEGCGASAECRHCQAGTTVTRCLTSGTRVVSEARVSARNGERLAAYDLRVTAAPLELASEAMAMVYFEDISATKRREHLEKIFLHDLLNSISCLQMLSEIPSKQSPAQWRRSLAHQVELLADEVRSHRLLTRAEQGDLVADISYVPVATLLEESLAGLKPLAEKRGVTLEISFPDEPVYLATDLKIARRVVLNAVKNALEAAATGERVRITAELAEPEVLVTVWNAQSLPEAIRHQLFQRSFSTKGSGRGLGTYSMRLLLEDYLGGRIGYASGPEGTTFELRFPSVEGYLDSNC